LLPRAVPVSSIFQVPGILHLVFCFDLQEFLKPGLQGFRSGIFKSLGINLDSCLCVDFRMSLQEPVDSVDSYTVRATRILADKCSHFSNLGMAGSKSSSL
jgi:hypothetical protein